MSKTLVRFAVALCAVAIALTAAQSARAADEKATATDVAKKTTMGGKIEAVDAAAGTITLKHKKETKVFTVAKDCTFGGADDKHITLADLKIGDSVKIAYTTEGDKLVAHHVGHVDAKKKPAEPAAPTK